MDVFDSLVIGAGQGGLSSSYHLKRLGIDHVLLDAEQQPGGAWQHRWDSLTMDDLHGVADLPDGRAPEVSDVPANIVVPRWFAEYERQHDLPVVRPVRVDSVVDEEGLLLTRSGDRRWLSRTLINATGSWRRPFLPHYPGRETFQGEQFHTVDYPGPEHFIGKRVVIVGAGASAVQFIGEIAPLTTVIWVTRRPPRWVGDDYSLRDLVRRVQEQVLAGKPPNRSEHHSDVMLREQEMEAARTGVFDRRRPMFRRIEPDGVRWDDGDFEAVDAILWATGFRPDIDHLAGLDLKSSLGGIQLLPGNSDPQTSVTASRDHRIQLVGYGPSASTIGGNRAGRAAAAAVRAYLDASSLR